MNKENKISINNLVYAILFLMLGIILLTSTEDLITIVSKVIGSILTIIGIIKTIIYVYMKGKLGEYSISKLAIALVYICFGMLFIFLSSTLSFAIRTIIGFWIVFNGVNRIIFAISMHSLDKKGFWIYFITSVLMIALGIIIMSGIFDKLIGLLIIIYAVIEIVNYIYFRVKNRNTEPIVDNVPKKLKKQKRLKKGKVVDAIIEEDTKK